MAGGSRSAATIAKAQRVKQFVLLRIQGLSYRAIADAWQKQTGKKISKSTVQNDIAAELQKLAEQTRSESEYYREIELTRLDMAMSAIARQVSQGDVQAVNALGEDIRKPTKAARFGRACAASGAAADGNKHRAVPR